jgi:hypothetical protein
MTAIVQVEFRPSILVLREELLHSLGHPVVSVLGAETARTIDLSDREVGVVVIGHGAPWRERCDLVAYFRETLSVVPIVVLLRHKEEPIGGADFYCPADSPPEWIRTVQQTLVGIQ